jgi:4-carboxymuconolactone decarboxylase
MGRLDPPDPLPDLVSLAAPIGGSAPITIVALAHSERLLAPFLGWAAALALEGQLAKREHEILALRTAHNCRSEFEWVEHARFARAAGLTDNEIDRIADGSDSGWSRAEQLLIMAADELHRDATICQTTWSELAAHYSSAQLVEAIFVVGQYTMLSMVANIAEAD